MVTVINVLPRRIIDENIRERVILRLTDPPSSIESRHNEMKSGLIRISDIKRFKREDKKLRKDFKFWIQSLSEIKISGNNEQEYREITHEDVDECRRFVRSCGNKCVILILSHSHAQDKELVSEFKGLRQIVAIYCYKTEEDFKELRKNWFIESQSFAREVLPRSVIGTQIKDLNKASQLLLTQIFISELIVNVTRADEAKEDFIAFCHFTYINDSTYKRKIEHFDRTYKEQDVIEWYTDPESFVFRIVSKTCTTLDIVTLFKTRLILRDLYIRLQKLHEEQLQNLLNRDITVYRGKMMSKNELMLIKTKRGLFITRHFLSTSTNRDVAVMHSGDGAIVTEEDVSVIIVMKINRTEMQDKPIAFIGDHSQLGSESEVMLSMGIVFRFVLIEEISMDSRCWVVINMVRGEAEKQIEKNLSRFHLVAQTGATCAALGMIPFLQSSSNSQHIEKYSTLMSHALKSSNPEVAEQLLAMSNSNIQPVLAPNSTDSPETHIMLNGSHDPISQHNVQIQIEPNTLGTNPTEQLIAEGTTNVNHIGYFATVIGTSPISGTKLIIALVTVLIVVLVVVAPLAVKLSSKSNSATTGCPPIDFSVVPSVQNPSSNYQVEQLDFTCSQSLSNMSIVQIVQRTLNETHAAQYQTFWNFSTNMTYIVTPTQLIYYWYSLPGMLIVKESFPNFVNSQFYYTPGSVRTTSNDTWQIWVQSICGDTLYLYGTY